MAQQLFQQGQHSCWLRAGARGCRAHRALSPQGPATSSWQAHRRLRLSPVAQAAAAEATEYHEQSLYSSQDVPIHSFGFSRGFSQRFRLEDKIGSGTFGVVHVAVHRQTGARFAVKLMPKRFAPNGALDKHFARRVINEVDICNHLGRSLNVCYLYETYEDDSSVDLVLELCTGGQLWDRILKGKYSEKQAAKLIQEILRTVALCHARGVLIRDVKPENFLFLSPEEGSPLKAVDFGISVFCRPDQYITHRAGTPIYLSPEVVRQHYSLSADVWSTGIVAYLLLTGRLPFAGEEGIEVTDLFMSKQVYNNKDVFRAILYADLDFDSPPWDTLSADARDFVQSLLQRDEALRPSAEKALQHRWLQELQLAPDVPLSDSIVQRLQRFGTYGQLKQLALTQVAHGIAADSSLIADLRDLFRQLDPQDTGKVSYATLQQALQDGHFNLTPSEAQQLMAQIDVDHSGDICFDQWIASLVDWRKVQDSAEWEALVTKAFEAIDANHSGRIGLEDLELLLCKGECEFPDVVEAALREADTNHDGGIDLPEFRQLLSAQPQLDLFEARLATRGGPLGGLLSSSDSSGSEESSGSSSSDSFGSTGSSDSM
ncbi:hypothetical protein N2152v2_011249 [Parachlorella kessleri]